MHTHDDPELAARRHRAPKVEREAADGSRQADPGNGSPEARSLFELQRLAGNASVSALVAREPAVVQEENAAEAAGGATRSPVLDVVGKGGGEPLQPELRTEMEGRLGASFGGVRIHRDSAAS